MTYMDVGNGRYRLILTAEEVAEYTQADGTLVVPVPALYASIDALQDSGLGQPAGRSCLVDEPWAREALPELFGE